MNLSTNHFLLSIDQASSVQILIPVVDAGGRPVDLTTLEGLSFAYGKEVGYPGDVIKRVGEPGCEIVTDANEELYGIGVENNALLVTLSEEETRITPGRLYAFAVWARGIQGKTLLARGEMEIVGTVWD